MPSNLAPPRTPWWQPAILVGAALAYANTFSVPFVFDDIGAVRQNPSIERFSSALSPPSGLSVTGRPVLNLSLALNFAVSGREVWSYHALNLLLHVGCGLLLRALLRRTLMFAPLRLPASSAGQVSFSVALLWLLHPLQTSAVTYVMQRSEVLVSFWFLLMLYGVARGTAAPSETPPHSGHAWFAVAIGASALGMATKEVMVFAPLVALLYDLTFLRSMDRARRARILLYAGLAGTWLPLATLQHFTDARTGSAGFGTGMAWQDYASTQLYAIGHYLRLTAWPVPMIFDYGTPLVLDALPVRLGLVLVAGLLIITFVAIRRRAAVGFGLGCLFALLAPSSSVIPVATQTIATHRVYLALAIPLTVVVVLLHRVMGTRILAWVAATAVACAVATLTRNHDFRSELSLWSDTAAKAPNNPRARYNHGLALVAAGQAGPAAAEFGAALALQPDHAQAHLKLGVLRLEAGATSDAQVHLESAVRLLPDSAAAHYQLATAFTLAGKPLDAALQYAAAVRLNPLHAGAHYNLGRSLADLGRYDEALARFEEAARLDPSDTSARANAERLRAYLRR